MNPIAAFTDSCRLHRDMMIDAADRHIERLEVRIAELRIFKTEIRRATDPLLGLPELPVASAEEEAEIARIAALLAPTLLGDDNDNQLAGEAGEPSDDQSSPAEGRGGAAPPARSTVQEARSGDSRDRDHKNAPPSDRRRRRDAGISGNPAAAAGTPAPEEDGEALTAADVDAMAAIMDAGQRQDQAA